MDREPTIDAKDRRQAGLQVNVAGATANGDFEYAVQIEGLDAGRKITIALREGVFLGLGTVIIFLLQILGVLTWWIGVLVFLVFVLVELALQS